MHKYTFYRFFTYTLKIIINYKMGSMAQVTIYLPASTLEAVKSVAAKEELSVSQWFAQYAHAQEKKKSKSWSHFLDDLDVIYGEDKPGGLDILLGKDRYADLAPIRDLEPL